MRKCLQKVLPILLFFGALANSAFSQDCSTILGQNPASAIPVCGTTTFHQDVVAHCDGPIDGVAHTGCAIVVTSSNSFWYKFHCYQSGTLGFLMSGISDTDDYDWELFDITGHNPNDVFTDPTLQVSLNIYGTFGNDNPDAPFPNSPTGCTPTGLLDVHCEGDDPSNSPFNRMPDIIVGHDYLLMVTNWTATSSLGYDLSFGGGTAIITDPVIPSIESVKGSCDNLQIAVKLNKKMKCKTLAGDGTDFRINYAGTSIINAVSAACSAGFDTDSLILTLSNPLPGGAYRLYAKLGTDANTMLDYCDVPIPVDDSVDLVIEDVAVPNFNFTGLHCTNTDITFADASTPIADIVNWHWDMGDGNIFDFNNGNPFTHQYAASGNKTVTLTVTTNRGCIHTIVKQININLSPVPSFTNSAACLPNGLTTFNNTSTIADASPLTYNWDFGDPASGANNTSTATNPTHFYTTPGPYTVTLTVTSNSSCINTITQIINNIFAQPKSSFTYTPEACINTNTSFNSTSDALPGNTITSYHWDFGDATTGTGATASHTYTVAGNYIVKHWIVNSNGCNSDTTSHSIHINQLPTPDFTYLAPNCETRKTFFTDASIPNDGTVNTWQWDFDDPASGANNTSALPAPAHIFVTEGIYNVKLTVTTDKGCTSSPAIVKQVTINARPHAGFIPPEVCLNDTYAQFNDNSTITTGTITNWQWDFGDPGSGPLNTSTATNPQHSYSAVGPYDVKLIVTSNNGCTDTLTQQIFVNGSFPVADVSLVNTGDICSNELVTITNLSTVFPGSITKVEIFWDDVNAPTVFELDDVPTPGKKYSHLYPSFQSPTTKDYVIRFRAYSGGVCMNDKLLPITINAVPKVIFDAIPDTCLLISPFKIVQASEPNGIPGNGVYSGPGITNPDGTFDPRIAGVGVHTITYTYTSLVGCKDAMSKTIRVLDTASAKFSFSAPPACDGTPVTFTDRSTYPASVVLANTVWDFGDLSPIENHLPGSTFTHTFPSPGSYTVTMYNTSAYGCSSTLTSQKVLVSPTPQTLFEFGETSVCIPNAKVSFINKSTISDGTENAFTYYWDFGDPASGSLNFSTAKTPPPHLYSGVGPYTVTLTVTSGARCSKNYTDVVDFIHPQPKAKFITDKKSVCLDESLLFTDVTDPLDGTTVSWHWDLGDGDKPITPIVNHTYAGIGTYNVSFYIINSHNCNSDTAMKSFTVYPYPVVNAGPDRRVLEGGYVKMQPVVSGDVLEYLWTPDIYLNNNRILAPMAQNIKNDITYRLTVTGVGGCPKSDDVFIKVLKNPKIPNTFTPNGDGINEKWVIQYLEDYTNCFVQVFTRTGQKVFESRGIYKPWDGTFNGKKLPFDTYYYIIEAGDGQDPFAGYVTIIK